MGGLNAVGSSNTVETKPKEKVPKILGDGDANGNVSKASLNSAKPKVPILGTKPPTLNTIFEPVKTTGNLTTTTVAPPLLPKKKEPILYIPSTSVNHLLLGKGDSKGVNTTASFKVGGGNFLQGEFNRNFKMKSDGSFEGTNITFTTRFQPFTKKDGARGADSPTEGTQFSYYLGFSGLIANDVDAKPGSLGEKNPNSSTKINGIPYIINPEQTSGGRAYLVPNVGVTYNSDGFNVGAQGGIILDTSKERDPFAKVKVNPYVSTRLGYTLNTPVVQVDLGAGGILYTASKQPGTDLKQPNILKKSTGYGEAEFTFNPRGVPQPFFGASFNTEAGLALTTGVKFQFGSSPQYNQRNRFFNF